MKQTIKHSILTWLLLLVSNAMLMAQDIDNGVFNPDNPPEPKAKFKVEVVSTEYAYASGTGTYSKGDYVYISTSANNENYQFSYWLKNGERYDEEQYFTYQMEEKNVTFEPVYDYIPVNPQEPTMVNTYRLFLETDDKENCSFNRNSGEKAEAGSSVWLSAYISQGYVFDGWYIGDQLVSEDQSFYYTMPAERVTLTARVTYSPDNPSDPSGTGQGNVDSGIYSPIATYTTSPRIYDLNGREVKKTKRGGIYIIHHKKVVFPDKR